MIIETTSTDEARKFKTDNLSTLIDSDFINKREALYLKLATQALGNADALEHSVVTTSSDLVTLVSHDTMRSLIGSTPHSDTEIIEQWLARNQKLQTKSTDIIVHTFSDFTSIHNRILERQNSGDSNEKFWGFNSPFFLNLYQERWKSITSHLSQYAIDLVSINTSTTSIEQSMVSYSKIRNKIK